MCDVKTCDAPGTILIEGGHIVCEEHGSNFPKYVCKFCHVQMVSKDNHHPVLGKTHGKKCPRRRLLG